MRVQHVIAAAAVILFSDALRAGDFDPCGDTVGLFAAVPAAAAAQGPGIQIDSEVRSTSVVEEYFHQQANPKLKRYVYDGNSSRLTSPQPRGFESSVYIGPWMMPHTARETPPRRSPLPPFLPTQQSFVELDADGRLRLSSQVPGSEPSPGPYLFTVPFTR